MLEPERERVAAVARRLAAEGLVAGNAGNVSQRAGELVAITPSGVTLSDVAGGDMVVVRMGGEPLEGEAAPSSELRLHLGIYERYGAGGVVHTHAPVATALACVLDEVPVVHYQMLLLGGPIRVAPYAPFGTPELATATLQALEGRQAALLANHGAVTFGDDVEHALERALLLEWACTIYWKAAAVGTPRVLSGAQLAGVDRRLAR